jgi:hypothetical protein
MVDAEHGVYDGLMACGFDIYDMDEQIHCSIGVYVDWIEDLMEYQNLEHHQLRQEKYSLLREKSMPNPSTLDYHDEISGDVANVADGFAAAPCI